MNWYGTFAGLLFAGTLAAKLACASQAISCPATAASTTHTQDVPTQISGLPDRVTDSTAACPIDARLNIGNEPMPAPEKSTASVDDTPLTTTKSTENAEPVVSNEKVQRTEQPDFNREIYYRNKLEFAWDVGALPFNIPFPFDFLEGDQYTEHPLKYTLVPVIASLRWHISNIGGPWIFRGNWDVTSSGSFTWIPSGPETRFISYDMGIRRNFVPRNQRFAPYYEIRLGVGQINAKGPKGVPYAQGENWPEFTMNMGGGVRYNFSPRFAFSGGINYMHLSNMDLSEHPPNATDPNWGPINYGINVFGPMLGIDVRLGKGRTE
ncbi:MAG TPA: hypothetical protein VF753_04370 [Terriglobales bacterium]